MIINVAYPPHEAAIHVYASPATKAVTIVHRDRSARHQSQNVQHMPRGWILLRSMPTANGWIGRGWRWKDLDETVLAGDLQVGQRRRRRASAFAVGMLREIYEKQDGGSADMATDSLSKPPPIDLAERKYYCSYEVSSQQSNFTLAKQVCALCQSEQSNSRTVVWSLRNDLGPFVVSLQIVMAYIVMATKQP